MPIRNCRVCNSKLHEQPLLRYENMPAVAQFLPDCESLAQDTGIDLVVCECSGCGLVQLNNDPVHYFKETIRASAFSEEMKDFRISQFSTIIDRFSLHGKKIIEIGCGRGEYLSLLKECGADPYGLEQSPESVQECLKNELNVSQGFMEHADFTIGHAPFDAFVILNFLEHLPDINTVLRGIGNNLTDNAIGLVEVPNFDMILRSKLFSEFTCDHLFYFTQETISQTLRLNGFEIVECNEIWHDYIISVVVRKRARLNLEQFHRHHLKLRSEIEEYINRFRGGKVAIWGAGHQALAIMSLMDLSGSIKYVVDSATFKQGRYTPATHIPIVSPETLESDPVDAVIVMAAGYSDEVSRIIRQRFDKNLRVSILRDHGLEIV